MKMTKEQANIINILRESNIDEDVIARIEISWTRMYQMGYQYGYNDAIKDLNEVNNED